MSDTESVESVQLRHTCRNPRCGCKLPEPVDNPSNAFCRVCFTSYFPVSGEPVGGRCRPSAADDGAVFLLAVMRHKAPMAGEARSCLYLGQIRFDIQCAVL